MTISASDNRRSIAQVNRMIRSIIEAETLENFFWAGGRIDRFYKSDLGHVYFEPVRGQVALNAITRQNMFCWLADSCGSTSVGLSFAGRLTSVETS